MAVRCIIALKNILFREKLFLDKKKHVTSRKHVTGSNQNLNFFPRMDFWEKNVQCRVVSALDLSVPFPIFFYFSSYEKKTMKQAIS